MSISPAYTFGKSILKTAEENGYIRQGTSPRDAHDAPYAHAYSRGGDCFYCWCPPSHQGNKDAGKECLALATVTAAATSLVFLGYTIKAIAEGTSYHSEKTYAQYQGMDVMTGLASRSVYAHAKHLLNGMENERTWTTISLALTTFGTALLTIAAIIALVVHPHFGAYATQIHQYCLYGGIFTGAGLILLTIVRARYGYYSLQNEADDLARSLTILNNDFYQPQGGGREGVSARAPDSQNNHNPIQYTFPDPPPPYTAPINHQPLECLPSAPSSH